MNNVNLVGRLTRSPELREVNRATSVATIFVATVLRRSYDKSPGLNRPGPKQDLPMRDTGRNGKCCRDRQYVGAGIGQGFI